jgi:hypothetical protein
MRCNDFDLIARDYARAEWVSAAVRQQARLHLETCEPCRQRLRANAALNEQMSALGLDFAAREAPPYLMPRVLAAFEQRRKPGGSYRRLWWASVAAAVCLIGAGLALWKRPQPEPAMQAEAPAELVTEFFPLRYGKPLEAGETLQMIRIHVPQSEMIRLGLPVAPEPALAVKADVLLGEDGLAKAIRIVY